MFYYFLMYLLFYCVKVSNTITIEYLNEMHPIIKLVQVTFKKNQSYVFHIKQKNKIMFRQKVCLQCAFSDSMENNFFVGIVC